jgi:cytochrome c oxidase cbb3-type subunit III
MRPSTSEWDRKRRDILTDMATTCPFRDSLTFPPNLRWTGELNATVAAPSTESVSTCARVWLAAAVWAATFSFVLLAPQLGARAGQAQGGRGTLLRFCPGLGIPCVEITREAYDRGHEQFRQSCGFCHGPTAGGGNGGPNLLFSAVIRRDNQGTDITTLIREGRPDKGMPVIPLTPTQVADIVGYLKARVAEVDKTSGLRPARDYDLKKLLTGNAELGKAYFNGAGQCATCHSPAGDLKGIATRYPPIELQARLMYPSDVRQQATVTDAAGKQFTGELLQRDAFDITIRTADGVQRSWPSRAVIVATTDRLARHLALLAKHSNADMHNLFAYLVTLR